MGWCSGSSYFTTIIKAVKSRVSDEDVRVEIYRPIFIDFLNGDWDTEDECLGLDPAYDRLYAEIIGEPDASNDDEY